jgi:hypothetical protein
MTEKWKIELMQAMKQIANTLPDLVRELERLNDRREAEEGNRVQYKERSTTSANQRYN